MTIRLQNSIIYGPVCSRRLGSSLGINLLSSQTKICNLNCVYCQYGWTTIKKKDLWNIDNFQDKVKVLEAVEKALFALSPVPDYITFSGNGEATLHPDFSFIVDGVVNLRNKYALQSKTAILSNSVGVIDQNVRHALARLDERIMKLDCGNENLLKFYNRPVVKISINEIVGGLKFMKDITIQTLFTNGPQGNFTSVNLNKWIERLIEISPKNVQIYTLDRGYPSDNIYPLSVENLIAIKDKLAQEGIPGEFY